MTIGIVVASGAENSWVEKKRDRGERETGRERKNKKMNKKNKERIFK